MKKKLVVAIGIIGACLLVGGWGNKTMVDTVYTFDKVIIGLPGGTCVRGKVESWTDFEDGDQIQVKVDGKVYFTHSSNVVLIKD